MDWSDSGFTESCGGNDCSARTNVSRMPFTHIDRGGRTRFQDRYENAFAARPLPHDIGLRRTVVYRRDILR